MEMTITFTEKLQLFYWCNMELKTSLGGVCFLIMCLVLLYIFLYSRICFLHCLVFIFLISLLTCSFHLLLEIQSISVLFLNVVVVLFYTSLLWFRIPFLLPFFSVIPCLIRLNSSIVIFITTFNFFSIWKFPGLAAVDLFSFDWNHVYVIFVAFSMICFNTWTASIDISFRSPFL